MLRMRCLVGAICAASSGACAEDPAAPVDDATTEDVVATDPVESPRAERIGTNVVATPIPTVARRHDTSTTPSDATSTMRRSTPFFEQFVPAARESRARGETVTVIEAAWVADLGPTENGRDIDQRWRTLQSLGEQDSPLSDNVEFILRQTSENSMPDSCLGITGLDGRSAVMAVSLVSEVEGVPVARPLYGIDRAAVMYPAETLGRYVLHDGYEIAERDLAQEVRSWRY